MFVFTTYFEESTVYRYSGSLYHAVLMLGGNDVGPRSSSQFFFLALILLLGAIINAVLFGNMDVMLQALYKKSNNFQEQLEKAHDAMNNLSMPDGIKSDVKYYLTYTRSTLDHQQELDSFLLMISPSLRQRVTHHIFHDTIGNNRIFSGNEEVLKLILPNLKMKLFLPEETIIRQAEPSNCMYFIARGE